MENLHKYNYRINKETRIASLELSSLLGVGELLIKPIIYFLHERMWYKFFSVKKR